MKSFLKGFARTAGLTEQQAATQWEGYSRQLSTAERQKIEAGGEKAGEKEGRKFAKDFAPAPTAMVKIRAALGIKRLNPRRLCLVKDEAGHWIADRASLTTATARALSDIRAATEREYQAACDAAKVIAGCYCTGICDWNELPEDWQDGSALGPITPL